MMNKSRNLSLMVLLSICVLLPFAISYAQRNQDPVRIYAYGGTFQDNSILMPNEFMKVDWIIEGIIWEYEGQEVGTANQYVTGIMKTDGKAMLQGWGVYTSSIDGLTGTLTYTIGNNWDMVSNEIWAFRMRIVGGTGDFEGIKGTATAEYPDFLMYLNFNPWE